MPKKGRLPQELWEHYRAMSVDVGRQIPFLANTSCMNMDERKMLALVEMAKRMFKEDAGFHAFLEEFVEPYFQLMGRAKWNRDIVSDLGLALALKRTTVKKLGEKLLDYTPEQ